MLHFLMHLIDGRLLSMKACRWLGGVDVVGSAIVVVIVRENGNRQRPINRKYAVMFGVLQLLSRHLQRPFVIGYLEIIATAQAVIDRRVAVLVTRALNQNLFAFQVKIKSLL